MRVVASAMVSGGGASVLVLALAACEAGTPLDVVNRCDVSIAVYSGTDNVRQGMSVRVDTIEPGATAATYVPKVGPAVIYIRLDGSSGWSGRLTISSGDSGEFVETFAVSGSVCEVGAGGPSPSP